MSGDNSARFVEVGAENWICLPAVQGGPGARFEGDAYRVGFGVWVGGLLVALGLGMEVYIPFSSLCSMILLISFPAAMGDGTWCGSRTMTCW